MRSVGRNRVPVTHGLMVIGRHMGGVTTSGWEGAGIVPLMKAHIGTILTTIITGRVGKCMKATGTMRITTESTGTMARITVITMMTTTISSREAGDLGWF